MSGIGMTTQWEYNQANLECNKPLIGPYVCTITDWENDVIDVVIKYRGDDIFINGFEDVEWDDADLFAQTVATDFNIVYVGDKTDD